MAREPDDGRRRLCHRVPGYRWTGELDAAARRLYGIAPAGTSFRSRVYYNAVSILDPDPFDRETYQVLATRSSPSISEPSPTLLPMPTDEIIQRIQRYLPSLGR